MNSLSFRQRLNWHYVDTLGQVRRALQRSTTMLDVGAGDGSQWGAVWEALKLDTTMVDRNSPSTVRHHQGRWKSVLAEATSLPFRDGSFDAVVALNVIEHMPKEAGFVFIDELERVAARTVVIITPCGFLPQPPAADNPYQEHVSGWLSQEFKERGYTVIGIAGPRPLRGMYGYPKIHPRRLGTLISMALQPFVIKMPDSAFALLAIKTPAPGGKAVSTEEQKSKAA